MDPPVEDTSKANESFTRAERIQQLGEVDQDITTLLELTGKAIQSLSNPSSSQLQLQDRSASAMADADAAPSPPKASEQGSSTESFKTAMNAFLTVLHSVDVRVKRQILSLEEAGIINLKNISSERGRDAALDGSRDGATKSVQKASLEPNGIGNIGNLEVGWLNSRSSKVERDMESELWGRARAHLENVAGGDGGGTADEDVTMQE